MLRALAALFFALALSAGLAGAQTRSEILVVDQERLFAESALGQKIAEEIEARLAELAAENRAIEAELVEEESELTARRSDLPTEEFRALADAFDEKVQRLRDEQDAKEAELFALRERERQTFSQVVGPILLDFMRRSGAEVMLDRRSVIVTAERVDVTDEVIDAIDAREAEAPQSPSPEANGQRQAEEAIGEASEADGASGQAPTAVPD